MRTERIIGVSSIGYGLGLLIIVPLWLTIIEIVIALPLMMIMHFANKSSVRAKIEEELRTKFPAFIGSKPEYIDTAVCGAGSVLKHWTGSGIAYAGGRIFILEEGLAAEIPWGEIRSWTWNVEGSTTTELYGSSNMGTRMQVNVANWRSQQIAARASGFTIVTANIDKPEWRFQTSDQKVLKRWMEILTQMSEGKLARN